MTIVAVGTVALDTIRTPKGSAIETLGGSATYFSLSASYFNQVRLVAVVGDDFPAKYEQLFAKRNIGTDALTHEPGKTFRWQGEYKQWNEAQTLKTELNVLGSFKPKLPPSYRHSPYLFLANIDPQVQESVLRQMNHPKLVFCDSMNYRIQQKRKSLRRLLSKVDGVFLNDSEARELAQEESLVKSALAIQKMGLEVVCIKKGDHGALLLNRQSLFICPAYPWTQVKDPTGAGDSFAGGFLGHLSRCRKINDDQLRMATVYGTVMASFAVEKFSVGRLVNLRKKEIQDRVKKLKSVTRIDMNAPRSKPALGGQAAGFSLCHPERNLPKADEVEE